MAAPEGVDLSRLQQHTPFRKLHLSLIDLMKYVSVGTSELLLYLLKETHVILECRACSNLFRDVPYLVAHKRFYCTQKYDSNIQTYGNSQGPPEGDLAAFFQAESPLNEKDFLKYSVELAKKNLQNSQVESCIRMEPTKKQFYDAVQKQLELTRANSPPVRSYSFEPLEHTNVAMKVVSNDNEALPAHQESTNCDSCTHSKECNSASEKNDGQNECKADSCSEKFNRSTSSSSISSMSSSCHSTDNKNEMTGSKPNVRNCQSEYKSLYCFKCNSTMPSQKAMSDHQLAVHPEDIRGRSGHTCGDSNNGNSFVDHSQQQINGLQNKVRKTDWLKPKGYLSSVEKIPPKPPTVNNAAKEALEAKKKAQANLIALKEEQLAYENEILQQKLIRGIIPKSSRGRKKFRCESCSKIFSKIESLRDHLRDCIDWEHVSQPIRNLKLPLPAVSDVNGPSLPMSAPPSVDWNDTSSDEPPKPPTPGPQFRSQVSKTENPRPLSVPPKSTARPQEKLPIKLRNINGVNKSVVENSTRGQVLVMNPKIKENEVILMPLSNANATNKPQSPKTTSPVEIYPKPPRIGDTSVVKSPILPTSMRTNHNTGNSSSDIINITGRNAQTVAPASHGSLKSPVTNEVKDIEIIAVNPPNTKDKTLLNLNNSKQQSPILKVNVNSREQVSTLPCNCLQCEAGVVNLDNPINDSSPTPSPTGCRDCDECQKSSVCSSACCMKDVEIVEQFTSLPPDGTNGKFSMPNCNYQQTVPVNDDVIITSHNFSSCGSKQNLPPVILTTNDNGPPNAQHSKQNADSLDECVLVSVSSQNDQISDSPINKQNAIYPVPITTSGKITACRSIIKPVSWKQYKCKFCIFSHKSFLGCKLHLKKKHSQKIRTSSIQCINHYIVDLKCRDKKTCCSFPGKQCRQLQNHKLNSLPTTGTSGFQKVTPQIKCSSSIRKCAQSTHLTKTLSISDKKDIEELMDVKKRQCLQCKHKFQKVSNLQRHVIRHLGKKDFQCKSCSLTMYTNSECRSHIKKQHLGKVKGITLKTLDQFIIDLRNKQKFSVSVKNNVDDSSVMVETDSKVISSKTHPEAARLSVLSTRKSSYQKQELDLEIKTKSTKRNMKK